MKIVRMQDGRRMPWKDGGGETIEIAVGPEGAGLDSFRWRLSAADVGTSGPFSTFAGVDRTLMVLSDAALDLAVTGRPTIRLSRDSEPYAFSGDAATMAELINGPARDLNVMSRRACVVHRVERLKFDCPLRVTGQGDGALVYLESGGVEIHADAQRRILEAGDTLVSDDGPFDCEMMPRTPSRVIVVHLYDADGARSRAVSGLFKR